MTLCLSLRRPHNQIFDMDLFGPPKNSIFGGLHFCAKFGWNRMCSFEYMQVSVLCEFGLKMPIHDP